MTDWAGAMQEIPVLPPAQSTNPACSQGSVRDWSRRARGRHHIAKLNLNLHCANLLLKDIDTSVTNVLDLIFLQCTDFPSKHFQALALN